MLGWQVAFNLAQGVLGDYNKRVGLAPRWMFMTVTILELYIKKPVVYNLLYFYQSVHLSLRTVCPTLPGPKQDISTATNQIGMTFDTNIHGPQRMILMASCPSL